MENRLSSLESKFVTRTEVEGILSGEIATSIPDGGAAVTVRPSLVHPRSKRGEEPTAVYASADDPIELRWLVPHNTELRHKLQFEVKWGTDPQLRTDGNPSFEIPTSSVDQRNRPPILVYESDSHYTLQTETTFSSLVIRLGDIPNTRQSQSSSGRIHWRVRPIGAPDSQDVGVFDFYPPPSKLADLATGALARMRETRTVRIGIGSSSLDDFRYDSGTDSQRDNGSRLLGFDVELAEIIVEYIGEKLGVALRPAFLTFDWQPLLNAPRENTVDFIISSITIRNDRRRSYEIEFSQPYYKIRKAILIKDSESLGTLTEFYGETVGARKASTDLRVAYEMTELESVREYDYDSDLLADLQNGILKAVVMDLPLARRLLAKDRNTSLKLVKPSELLLTKEQDKSLTEFYGIAMSARQKPLLALINKALEDLDVWPESRVQRLLQKYNLLVRLSSLG